MLARITFARYIHWPIVRRLDIVVVIWRKSANTESTDATEPFIGNMSFYRFNTILSGSCAAFAILSILILLIIHSTHLSKPNEQIKSVPLPLLYHLFKPNTHPPES
jgi:hypothetical protein